MLGAKHRARSAMCLALMVAAAVVIGDDGSSAAASRTDRYDAASAEVGGDPVVIRTDHGPVRGLVTEGVREFLSIPFAAPPVGLRRWRPPKPPDPWTEPLDATTAPPSCPQVILGTTLSGKEDCLYLNVYAPQRPAATLAPVMVWIYGGGFTAGSSQVDIPDEITRHSGFVTVSFNYRLGPLGFLAHPDLVDERPDGATGTLGIEDQQAALRWVHDNIANFGGDPRTVTIFGQSAGGVSVCDHLLSDGSKGLFRRAIVQSGPCTSASLTRGSALAQGKEYARHVGCTGPGALECLRAQPVEDLLKTDAPSAARVFDRGGVTWAPVRDGVVIPVDPAKAFESGDFHRVPVLLGANANEGRFFVGISRLGLGSPVSADEWGTLSDDYFGPALAPRVRKRYPLEEFPSPGAALGQPIGDKLILCPVRDTALLTSRYVPTYLYEFAYGGSPFVLPLKNFIELGAFHNAEMPFVFGRSVQTSGTYAFNGDERTLSDAMIGYWTRFAATGTPNGGGAPEWPTYTSKARHHLVFDTGALDVGTDLSRERCDFWAGAGSAPR